MNLILYQFLILWYILQPLATEIKCNPSDMIQFFFAIEMNLLQNTYMCRISSTINCWFKALQMPNINLIFIGKSKLKCLPYKENCVDRDWKERRKKGWRSKRDPRMIKRAWMKLNYFNFRGIFYMFSSYQCA